MNFSYYAATGTVDVTIIGRFLSFNGPLGCDVETVSLKDRTPLGAAFAINKSEAFYFPIDSPLFPWDKLQDPNIPIIFHNSGFDVTVLEKYSRVKITNYKDSCLAAKILGLPAKLSLLCEWLYGRTPRRIEELIGEKGPNQLTMAQVPQDKVAQRACLDAREALEVWNDLAPTVPQRALELDLKVLPLALDIENRGIRIDLQAVEDHKQRLLREVTSIRMLCEGQGFNPGSSPQLAAYLESLGVKVKYRTKRDAKGIVRRRPMLNKEMLEVYYSRLPVIQNVLKYRRSQALLTHLIRPLSEGRYLDGDYIHPRLTMDITDSGRFSRSNPATQNMTEELRNIVIAPDGYEIVVWDFSQIELRWAAYLWDDKVMQDMFARGMDIHTGTAKRFEDLGLGHLLGSTADTMRDTAKMMNFLIIYLGDEETMWQRSRIPHDQGRALLKGYFETFKGIADGIERTKRFALKHGYTETFYGRRRSKEEDLDSGNPHLIEKALRELVNHPIQGSAAETMKEALVANQDADLFHTVHDEGDEYTLQGERRTIQNNVAPFDTPIKIKRGINWRDLKEVVA